jgi:hypothetical protein
MEGPRTFIRINYTEDGTVAAYVGAHSIKDAERMAQLLTAAPELLEACEAVLHDAELRGVSVQAPYNTVRAAIKKAKGE